jgi:hypothetical protein
MSPIPPLCAGLSHIPRASNGDLAIFATNPSSLTLSSSAVVYGTAPGGLGHYQRIRYRAKGEADFDKLVPQPGLELVS